MADSPQAKGRIERLFGTFQNRLIKEMRLRNIKDYRQANIFLEKEYIAYHNKKFAHKEGIESVYKPLPQGINLDFIFCKKFERKVNFDNTIKLEGQIIQLPPTSFRLSFAKCVVCVCLLEDGNVYILYRGELIHSTRLSKNNKIYKIKRKIERFLNQREYQLCSV